VLVCVLFFGVLEAVLAVAGFKPVLYERDPYVGFAGSVPLFVKVKSASGEEVYVTAKNKTDTFNPQQFPATKAKNAFRIFCMGGSTTYGHPYRDPTSFCGWLRASLPKADPSRDWQLINCGGISYASYREALLMEELVKYQPDLFIVLSGQNEFLEHRTYSQIITMPPAVRGLAGLAAHTRVFAAVKAATDRLKSRPRDPSNVSVLAGEVKPLLEGGVGLEVYHRDDELTERIVEHFRFNLARMVDIAHSVGAKVIFVTPPSNLRDCSPFKSENRVELGEAEIRRWQGLMSAAERAYTAQDWSGVLSVIDQANAIDGRFAMAHYLRGHALWELGRFAEAKDAFVRAKDEDVCPLRALTSIVDGVRQVASQRNVPLVDFVQMVDQLSEHQTPGDDWFLDHVHPTIEGNRRLALSLIDVMTRNGFAHPLSTWNEASANDVKRDVEGRLDRKAHGSALLSVARVMSWAEKYEDAYRASLRAEALSPDDASIQCELAKDAVRVGRVDEGISHFRRALELDQNTFDARLGLSLALASKGQLEEAISQCRAGLKLAPTYPPLHSNLAVLLSRAGRTDEAIQESREAVRLSPYYAEAHGNLAWLLMSNGQPTEALAEFREADRLKPGMISTEVGLAWLLATHPDEKLRDPGRAIALAGHLAESSHYGNWMVLNALAHDACPGAAGKPFGCRRSPRASFPL
jgi:tetratricopeptide (TPR) repeat protein